MIVSTGWLLPQIFTANWVRKSKLKKTIPVKVGFFAERIPVFLLVPSVLLASVYPLAAAILMLILIAWHHLGSGLIAVSWQELVAKIIPLEKRGSFYGIANLGGMGTGILSAAVSAWFLRQLPFPAGYILCFACAAFFVFLSWLLISQIREPEEPVKPECPVKLEELKTNVLHAGGKIPGKKYWGALVGILRDDRN